LRNNDPIFFPSSNLDVSLRQNRQKNYTDCINILQTQWYQADLDQRFVIGDQDIWGLIFPGVATYRRKIWNFNLTNSAIQMISGYQRRNRKTSICIPVMKTGQATADQFSKTLFYSMNRAGAYQVFSDCFEMGALTQGLGFLSIFPDYNSDPISPDIRYRYVDMKSMLFDPYFRSHSLEDCRFIWTRQFFDRQEAAVLYPQFADDILSLPGGTYRDDKFYYMPEVYQIQFPNLIAFDEYWYLSSREVTYIIDKETEECQEWTGDEEQLRDFMRMRDPQDGIEYRKKLATDKKQKPTVRRSIILNDKDIIDEANPYRIDRYPYVPCLGYMTADTPYYAYKFRGVARDMRDAQYLMSRMQVNNLDQVEAQQSGIKMEKGALVTPDDALNQGNGRVLTTATGMFDKVEKLHIDPPSPVLLQMQEMLKEMMIQISGAKELLGLAEDTRDLSGIALMIRQSASVTGLQKLFDQFDEFQRIAGDITIQMQQSLWSVGKVQQILGEQPTEEFQNKLFFKYACKVVTGVLTESQQQMEAQQLMQIKELGGPIEWSDILPKLTVQNKEELLERMQQREQAAAQQQQQMAQLQMQQLQVDNETKLAYAASQKSLAGERTAKIQTDVAIAEDKLKRAHQEDTHSMLNLVKTLKELQGMDLDNIIKNVQILNELSGNVSPSTQTQSQEAV
jgi:hypothetical protein